MIKNFIKYGKFREYFSLQFENKFAFISMILILAVFCKVNFYSDFERYQMLLNDLCIALIGAYIGSLALIFSGVVFLGSLLSNEFEKDLIRYTGDPEVAIRLYISYLFLAFNILCTLVVTFIVLIFMNSNLPKPSIVIFFGLIGLYIYLSFFVMAYLVALIRNTVDLIRIEDDKEDTKSFYDRVNEIRIDMIFQYLYSHENPDDIKKDLKSYFTHYISLLDCPVEEKKKYEEYFAKYYELN